VGEFHTLPHERVDADSALAAGELIEAIELPAPAPRSAYVKVRERESYEYALVSAAVALELDGELISSARIALGSVALRPWRLHAAERALAGISPEHPEAAAALDRAMADARVLAHNAFKVKLARNAALRALRIAAGVAP
jgi:xanthine dehydrogenase YagS FAD-binding subunit